MSTEQSAGLLRVGVLMGGRSIEREVSFNSGRTICDHLDTSSYKVIPIFQTESGELYILPLRFLHRGKIADFRDRLADEAELITWDTLKKCIDFAYIAQHGRYGEDGVLQGMLEVLNIPYLGAKVFGSALSMHKGEQKKLLKHYGINVPNGIVIQAYDLDALKQEDIEEKLVDADCSYPIIVKPDHEGSSLGVSVVHEPKDLIPAIKKAAYIDENSSQNVIVEEKVEGMEFVGVSLQRNVLENNKARKEWFTLPLTEVVIEKGTEFFDYDQKYMPGRATKITPARCDNETKQRISKVVQRVSDILNFTTISRIDAIVRPNGEVVVIDPNTLTGMAPATFLFHQAADFGMSHAQLINYLIKTELQNYGLLPVNQQGQDLFQGAQVASDNEQKMRVAVLLGGDSHEREISLESGRNVCYKLHPSKYDVTPLFVNDEMRMFKLSQKLLIKNSTRDIADLVTVEDEVTWAELPKLFDFVFIGLHGGKGENGSVQGALEMLGLPYNGPGILTSALCMDKYRTNQFLKAKGFDTPGADLIAKDFWIGRSKQEKESFAQDLVEQYALPLIVKPHDDGCSMFVRKAQSVQELVQSVDEIFEHDKKSALVEEFVQGIELTCGVYGNDEAIALPPSHAVAKESVLSIKEKFLPGDGQNITPAHLDDYAMPFVKRTMEQVYQAVGCKGYTRIDCFFQSSEESPTGNPRVVVLELNTLPGLTPATCLFHQAAEVDMQPMAFIDKLVELGLALHTKQSVVVSSAQKLAEPTEAKSKKPKAKKRVVSKIKKTEKSEKKEKQSDTDLIDNQTIKMF